eukprot:2099108-Prymnesium_polylepis.1
MGRASWWTCSPSRSSARTSDLCMHAMSMTRRVAAGLALAECAPQSTVERHRNRGSLLCTLRPAAQLSQTCTNCDVDWGVDPEMPSLVACAG